MVLGLQPIQPTEAEIKLICPLMPEIAFRLQTGKNPKDRIFPVREYLEEFKVPVWGRDIPPASKHAAD